VHWFYILQCSYSRVSDGHLDTVTLEFNKAYQKCVKTKNMSVQWSSLVFVPPHVLATIKLPFAWGVTNHWASIFLAFTCFVAIFVLSLCLQAV